MTDSYTADCFASDHVVQTDMQNIENNFASLNSSFAGSAAPSNPVAGKLWFDTDVDQLYIRNADNDQWLTIDFIPGTIMLFGQASAPLGWTKITAWADKAMLTISSDADATPLGSGGTDNPQAAHTHSGGAHTHTGASHVHQWHDYIGTLVGEGIRLYNSAGAAISISTATLHPASVGVRADGGVLSIGMDAYTAASGTADSGAASGNTGSNTIPKYQEVIACSKN